MSANYWILLDEHFHHFFENLCRSIDEKAEKYKWHPEELKPTAATPEEYLRSKALNDYDHLFSTHMAQLANSALMRKCECDRYNGFILHNLGIFGGIFGGLK